LIRLSRVESGLGAEKLLVFYVSPPGDKYRPSERLPAYANLYQSVIARIRGVPGVAGASGANTIPHDGAQSAPTGMGFTIEGRTPEEQKRNPSTVVVRSGPGYFDVAGIPLLEGRDFRETEDLTSPLVAIVSRSAGERFWSKESPLGRRLKAGPPGAQAPWAEVVGVVGDVRYRGLDSEDTRAVYFSFNQRTAGDLHYAVRAQGDPEGILDSVRRAIAAEDPQVAIYNARTMETVLADSTWRERLWSSTLSIYAAAALLLAAVGIYGVVSYLVSRRAREMGIRVSLGATRRAIVRLVQGELATLLLVGSILGLVGAVALTSMLEGLVFGATGFEIGSLLVALVTVVAMGLGAGLLPALRASKTNPIEVLGSE
jgi:putative ABC transport system permease protein